MELVEQDLSGRVIGACIEVSNVLGSDLTSAHEAQLLNYLKGTGLQVGLLVNLGTPKIHWKRLVR